MKKPVLWMLMLLLFMVQAFSATPQPQESNKVFFNTKTATTQLDTIVKQLPDPNRKVMLLNQALQTLEEMHDQAEVCVSDSAAELEKINALLKTSAPDSSALINQKEYKYLQQKKLFYAKQLSDCRLYTYRSMEVITSYKEAINKLVTHKILTRSTPIWRFDLTAVYNAFKTINYPYLHQILGFEKIGISKAIFAIILLGLGVIIAIYLRSLCRHWLKNHSESTAGSVVLLVVFSHTVVALIFFLVLSALTTVYFTHDVTGVLLRNFSYYVTGFIVLLALSRLMFSAPGGYESLSKLPNSRGKQLHKRLRILLGWVFFGAVIVDLPNSQSQYMQLSEFASVVYLSISIGLFAWFAWLLYGLPSAKKANHALKLITQIVLTLVIFSSLSTIWLGYYSLIAFIIQSVLQTVLLVFCTIAVISIIKACYIRMDDLRYAPAKVLRHVFGVKSNKKQKEIAAFKYVGYVVTLYISITLIMCIWEVSPNIIDAINDIMLSGFTLSGVKIVPVNFIIATLAFSLIMLLGRLIATISSRKAYSRGEKDTQVAFASIIVYVSFAIALLLALLIIGVNFTGLAIIAGALSVGVGLGLQDIVNNFVSGIVLLLEKPIKPGDRVIVGGSEGFVKKIRLRSTQITTLAKEDVIVPNADLIANQVTNYMFRDRYWRAVCQVGVAYGSDVEKVKALLLETAAEHPDVVQLSPNEPVVIFKSFGESSLVFELWCIIKDVNKKFMVVSELNFAINAAFKSHDITIAFPQRDIHLKQPIKIQQD